MNIEAGYTARWHLIHGLPVPKGEPLDYVLNELEKTLGKPIPSPVPEKDKQPIIPLSPAPSTKPTYSDVIQSSPNKGGTLIPKGIVFHSSYGSAAGSLSWIKNSASKVSYHTMIFPDGTRYNVVPYDRQAWHAGRSTFKGRSGCNQFMIGLSFEGDLYKRQLTDDEINSAVEIAVRLAKKYNFGIDWITDHRTVSPGRKEDIPPSVLAMLKQRIKAELE